MTLSDDLTSRELQAQITDLMAHNESNQAEIAVLRRQLELREARIYRLMAQNEQLQLLVSAYEGQGRAV